MKLTIDNYKELIPEENQLLIHGLILDLEELNNELENIQESYRKLYIDYENDHTKYSPERTDPCPDYYGCFRLRFENNPTETVGDYVDLWTLDNVICALVNFVEFQPK